MAALECSYPASCVVLWSLLAHSSWVQALRSRKLSYDTLAAGCRSPASYIMFMRSVGCTLAWPKRFGAGNCGMGVPVAKSGFPVVR